MQVVLRQESTRSAGAAITPEEEALRSRLESLHSQLSAPTQFNVYSCYYFIVFIYKIRYLFIYLFIYCYLHIVGKIE